MKIKLDENLSRHLKKRLSDFGHDVSTVADENLLGHVDPEIARHAASDGRMLFTLDGDFADIRSYSPGSHPGIVLFKPRALGPAAVAALVVEFAAGSDLERFVACLVIVEPDRVRVRIPGDNRIES